MIEDGILALAESLQSSETLAFFAACLLQGLPSALRCLPDSRFYIGEAKTRHQAEENLLMSYLFGLRIKLDSFWWKFDMADETTWPKNGGIRDLA